MVSPSIGAAFGREDDRKNRAAEHGLAIVAIPD